MEKGEHLTAILRSPQTLFSYKELTMLWGDSGGAARVRIHYYLKHGKLYHLRRGLYAKDQNYNRFELANKIYTPSYISFETVLSKAGIIFQNYSNIFIASYLTREIICDGQTYSYKRVHSLLLTNSAGIEHHHGFAMATKERAFLDTICINKEYHFDNLTPLNWDAVFELLPIYNNARIEKRVRELHDHAE